MRAGPEAAAKPLLILLRNPLAAPKPKTQENKGETTVSAGNDMRRVCLEARRGSGCAGGRW